MRNTPDYLRSSKKHTVNTKNNLTTKSEPKLRYVPGTLPVKSNKNQTNQTGKTIEDIIRQYPDLKISLEQNRHKVVPLITLLSLLNGVACAPQQKFTRPLITNSSLAEKNPKKTDKIAGPREKAYLEYIDGNGSLDINTLGQATIKLDLSNWDDDKSFFTEGGFLLESLGISVDQLVDFMKATGKKTGDKITIQELKKSFPGGTDQQYFAILDVIDNLRVDPKKIPAKTPEKEMDLSSPQLSLLNKIFPYNEKDNDSTRNYDGQTQPQLAGNGHNLFMWVLEKNSSRTKDGNLVPSLKKVATDELAKADLGVDFSNHLETANQLGLNIDPSTAKELDSLSKNFAKLHQEKMAVLQKLVQEKNKSNPDTNSLISQYKQVESKLNSTQKDYSSKTQILVERIKQQIARELETYFSTGQTEHLNTIVEVARNGYYASLVSETSRQIDPTKDQNATDISQKLNIDESIAREIALAELLGGNIDIKTGIGFEAMGVLIFPKMGFGGRAGVSIPGGSYFTNNKESLLNRLKLKVGVGYLSGSDNGPFGDSQIEYESDNWSIGAGPLIDKNDVSPSVGVSVKVPGTPIRVSGQGNFPLDGQKPNIVAGIGLQFGGSKKSAPKSKLDYNKTNPSALHLSTITESLENLAGFNELPGAEKNRVAQNFLEQIEQDLNLQGSMKDSFRISGVGVGGSPIGKIAGALGMYITVTAINGKKIVYATDGNLYNILKSLNFKRGQTNGESAIEDDHSEEIEIKHAHLQLIDGKWQLAIDPSAVNTLESLSQNQGKDKGTERVKSAMAKVGLNGWYQETGAYKGNIGFKIPNKTVKTAVFNLAGGTIDIKYDSTTDSFYLNMPENTNWTISRFRLNYLNKPAEDLVIISENNGHKVSVDDIFQAPEFMGANGQIFKNNPAAPKPTAPAENYDYFANAAEIEEEVKSYKELAELSKQRTAKDEQIAQNFVNELRQNPDNFAKVLNFINQHATFPIPYPKKPGLDSEINYTKVYQYIESLWQQYHGNQPFTSIQKGFVVNILEKLRFYNKVTHFMPQAIDEASRNTSDKQQLQNFKAEMQTLIQKNPYFYFDPESQKPDSDFQKLIAKYQTIWPTVKGLMIDMVNADVQKETNNNESFSYELARQTFLKFGYDQAKAQRLAQKFVDAFKNFHWDGSIGSPLEEGVTLLNSAGQISIGWGTVAENASADGGYIVFKGQKFAFNSADPDIRDIAKTFLEIASPKPKSIEDFFSPLNEKLIHLAPFILKDSKLIIEKYKEYVKSNGSIKFTAQEIEKLTTLLQLSQIIRTAQLEGKKAISILEISEMYPALVPFLKLGYNAIIKLDTEVQAVLWGSCMNLSQQVKENIWIRIFLQTPGIQSDSAMVGGKVHGQQTLIPVDFGFAGKFKPNTKSNPDFDWEGGGTVKPGDEDNGGNNGNNDNPDFEGGDNEGGGTAGPGDQGLLLYLLDSPNGVKLAQILTMEQLKELFSRNNDEIKFNFNLDSNKELKNNPTIADANIEISSDKNQETFENPDQVKAKVRQAYENITAKKHQTQKNYYKNQPTGTNLQSNQSRSQLA